MDTIKGVMSKNQLGPLEYFCEIDIGGYRVVIRKMSIDINIFYNAYVELPHSEYFSFSGSESFREGDIIGIDTAHSHNKKMTQVEKLRDAIEQISAIIERYKEMKR